MENKKISASAGTKYPENRMRIGKNDYAPIHQIENEHDHSFPVIHIDLKGRILYANRASFPLLGEWNCIANEYLPEKLVTQNPGLLSFDAAFEMKINTRTFRFHLDVIGFKESGYIGLYGFLTEENKYNGISVALSV